MNNSYREYLSGRLKTGNKYSSQYLYAITATDCYGAETLFHLLLFFPSECLLLCCHAVGEVQKRVAISSCKSFEHHLDQIISAYPDEQIRKFEHAFSVSNGQCQYDPYYDGLSSALSQYKDGISSALNAVELDSDIPVYVCGQERFLTKAVMYALQQKNTHLVMMQKQNELKLNEAKRVHHLVNFNSMYLNTSETMSVSDCFSPHTFFIPLCDKTLDSVFCNDTKWRDLLKDTHADDCCYINGVACKCVSVKMRIDVFNNVFCSVFGNGAHLKTVLLYNALDEPLPDDKPKLPSKVETGQTIVQTPPETSTARSSGAEAENNNTTMNLSAPVEGYEGIKLETDGIVPYSIEDLFGYYLLDNGGVTEICFRDPFLYQDVFLLQAFIHEILTKLGNKLTKFRTFKIVTRQDEMIAETIQSKLNKNQKEKSELEKDRNKYKPVVYNDKMAEIGLKKKMQQKNSWKLKKFQEIMPEVEKELKERNITLVREDLKEEDPEGDHKRTMIFDNGWCIDMEGGLNKLFHRKEDMDIAKCGKTTLYYYHKGERTNSQENPYTPPKNGKACIVKVITKNDTDMTTERLFKYYLLDNGGTSHVEFRDRYLISKKTGMLMTFIQKLSGISRVANRDNSEIKIVDHFTLYVWEITKNNRPEFEKKISYMKSEGVSLELKELSSSDKEGDHKRSLKFVDNGWCIDLEGGLDKLYGSEMNVRDGICQPTTLYYSKEA